MIILGLIALTVAVLTVFMIWLRDTVDKYYRKRLYGQINI